VRSRTTVRAIIETIRIGHMIGPPLWKLSIRKFELKTPPDAAGEGEAAGAALAVAAGEAAVVAGGSPFVAAGDIPGARAGDIAGAPKGVIPGAAAAGLVPRAGVVAGATCGGTAGGAAGDVAGGGGWARLASASVKEQKQTVSGVFIFKDGWKTGSIR
jgi:hypothetical protein